MLDLDTAFGLPNDGHPTLAVLSDRMADVQVATASAITLLNMKLGW